MKTQPITARAVKVISQSALCNILLPGVFLLASMVGRTQAITEITTDYNGYWKSGVNAINSIKPDNSHNLLAFKYNGMLISTGVDDAKVAAQNGAYTPADFWALPMSALTGTITSNTKAGFGALYDGVFNGAGNPAPQYGIAMYLSDGIKGLNLGTCIANLPVGSLTFPIQNINVATIGDGLPDVLITQVADPTGSSYDRYEFVDANGIRVGNYKDIVFSNIAPVANWTADFYEASQNPFALTSGFTQTDRPLRLFAADLSEFGITTANYSQISKFKINLCGNSDVAFVAYNNTSISLTQPLPVQYNNIWLTKSVNAVTVNWETSSESEADYYDVERSSDGVNFYPIGKVRALNSVESNRYSFTDGVPQLQGKSCYRLKQVDKNGRFSYTKILYAGKSGQTAINLYPNPATGTLFIEYTSMAAAASLSLYNASGILIKSAQLPAGSTRVAIDTHSFLPGNYIVVVSNGNVRTSHQVSLH